MGIFMSRDVSISKGQSAIGLSERYPDCIVRFRGFCLVREMEDVKGASHLSGEDRSLEKGIGKDSDEISCDDKGFIHHFLDHCFTSIICDGQIYCPNPSTDERGLHVGPEIVTAEMMNSDQ